MRFTRRTLAGDLAKLGVRDGDLLMVHASVRRIGNVTGGVNSIVHALRDAVGERGTIAAYVDFESFCEEGETDDVPVFDKRIAHAARDHGVLHETLRTWPGTLRSDHPDAGVCALGALAGWLTADHPFAYGYGPGSPFEKICQAKGRVLMLGAPLDTITLLHYAEHLANIPDKRVVRYRRLMPDTGGPKWIWFEEYDTSTPVHAALPEDCFGRIARDYLAEGNGRQDMVGAAPSFLFEGADLVRFGRRWIEDAVRGG